MPEQMTLTPEPTAPPQTETAPAKAALPDEVPHFGNMPEGSTPWTPPITFAEEPAAAESNPEPVAAEGQAATLPPPAASQSQPPQSTGQDFFQALAAYEMWKEGRAAEKNQAEQFKNWEPPAITEQEAEAMLTDPKTIAATFKARDKWHRDATVNLMKPLVEKVQQLEQQVNTVNYREHQEAWNDVRDTLKTKGIDADKYYPQIYQSVQQNPATAAGILGNAQALYKAVMFLHDGDDSPFTATPETAQRPLTAGNGQQAATETRQTFRKDEAILKAEKAFGRPFSKESLKTYWDNKKAGGSR